MSKQLQQTLTQLGEQGWELVTCERNGDHSSYHRIVLKRLCLPTTETYGVD
jgi:hypothetical protein